MPVDCLRELLRAQIWEEELGVCCGLFWSSSVGPGDWHGVSQCDEDGEEGCDGEGVGVFASPKSITVGLPGAIHSDHT